MVLVVGSDIYFQMPFSLDYIHAFSGQNNPVSFATQSTVSTGMWRVLSSWTTLYCTAVFWEHIFEAPQTDEGIESKSPNFSHRTLEEKELVYSDGAILEALMSLTVTFIRISAYA